MTRKAAVSVLILTTLSCGGGPGGGGDADPAALFPPLQGTTELGAHLSAHDLVEYSYADAQWVEEDPQNVAPNLSWYSSKGFTTFLVDVMTADQGGQAFFQSSVLSSNGYKFYKDFLGTVVAEAHLRGLAVFADITVPAWRMGSGNPYAIQGNVLTPAQVQQLCAELLDGYGCDGIVEETYPQAYVKKIAETCAARGKPYIHKFDDPSGSAPIVMSEDYRGFLNSPQALAETAALNALMNNVGHFNAVFTHAAAVGTQAWVKTSGGYGLGNGGAGNILLLRAAQFGSPRYFFMPVAEHERQWLRTLDTAKLVERIRHLRTPLPGSKPIVNIVVDDPGDEIPVGALTEWIVFNVQAFGPISNALLLAGFDVRTTYREFLPGAAAYYVLAPGVMDGTAFDLSAGVAPVFDSAAPVWLTVAGRLPHSGNWQAILPKLGIRPDWTSGSVASMPATVSYAGKTVAWAGLGFWEVTPQTSTITPADVTGGEVLLAGGGHALILRKGRKYFLNGNLLHLEVDYVIGSLAAAELGTVARLQAPARVHGIVGARSAFFGMGDAAQTVSASLPFATGEAIRVIRFSADGKVTSDATAAYSGAFTATLARNELLIVEPAGLAAGAWSD